VSSRVVSVDAQAVDTGRGANFTVCDHSLVRPHPLLKKGPQQQAVLDTTNTSTREQYTILEFRTSKHPPLSPWGTDNRPHE